MEHYSVDRKSNDLAEQLLSRIAELITGSPYKVSSIGSALPTIPWIVLIPSMVRHVRCLLPLPCAPLQYYALLFPSGDWTAKRWT